MSHKIQYVALIGFSTAELAFQVNQHMADGWRLHGGLAFIQENISGERRTLYGQAMIKES